MNKKAAAKAVKVLLEVALEKMAKATRLAGSIISDEAWIEFDKTCNEAGVLVTDALCCGPYGFLPEEDEKKLIGALKELHAIRIEVWINWQMLWREAEALRDPTGKYGVMRAEREALATALKDEDDIGNGHHSPKP